MLIGGHFGSDYLAYESKWQYLKEEFAKKVLDVTLVFVKHNNRDIILMQVTPDYLDFSQLSRDEIGQLLQQYKLNLTVDGKVILACRRCGSINQIDTRRMPTK